MVRESRSNLLCIIQKRNIQMLDVFEQRRDVKAWNASIMSYFSCGLELGATSKPLVQTFGTSGLSTGFNGNTQSHLRTQAGTFSCNKGVAYKIHYRLHC